MNIYIFFLKVKFNMILVQENFFIFLFFLFFLHFLFCIMWYLVIYEYFFFISNFCQNYMKFQFYLD